MTTSNNLTKHQYRIDRINECATRERQFVVLVSSVKHIEKVLLAAVAAGYTHDGGLQPNDYASQLTSFPDDVVVSFYPVVKRVAVHNHRCGCTPVDIERPKRTFQERCDKLLRKIAKRGKNASIKVSSQAHCDAIYEAAQKIGITIDGCSYWTTYTPKKTHVIVHLDATKDAVGVYNHAGDYRVYALPKE